MQFPAQKSRLRPGARWVHVGPTYGYESSVLNCSTLDPYQMKVKELKDWLRKKNLPTLGSKSLLIERVREAMKAGKRRVSFTFVSDNVTESVNGREKHKQSGEAHPSTSFWRSDDRSNEFISR